MSRASRWPRRPQYWQLLDARGEIAAIRLTKGWHPGFEGDVNVARVVAIAAPPDQAAQSWDHVSRSWLDDPAKARLRAEQEVLERFADPIQAQIYAVKETEARGDGDCPLLVAESFERAIALQDMKAMVIAAAEADRPLLLAAMARRDRERRAAAREAADG